jgi:uncharacterized membrane protein YozB (DUF420 family)
MPFRRIALLLLAAAYFTLLLRNTCFFAAGPDSSGYLGEAKMFASGRVRVEIAPLRVLKLDPSFASVFTPVGFERYRETTEMVPTYPPGLPLHFALAGMIGGWTRGPFLVSTLAAILALLLIYAVARELGLSRELATGGAFVLAASPIFISFAMQPMSDLPAAAWALAAMWLACRGARFTRPAAAAALAGVAFAIGVAVRPTNVLLGIALLFALRRARNIAAAALGALPMAAALAWWNHVQYGSWRRLSYGTVGEVVSAAFPCLAFHMSGILRVLTPVVVLAGLFVVVMKNIDWRTRAMLISWFATFFVFYSAYGYCDLWLSSRFLLPAIPALILAALLVVKERRTVAVIAVVIVVILEARSGSKLKVFRFDDYESVFPESVAYVEQRLPRDALVISGVLSGAFYDAGRWTARWDRLDAERFAALRAAAHGPIYAMISDQEVPAAELHRRLPGRFVALGRTRDVTFYRID